MTAEEKIAEARALIEALTGHTPGKWEITDSSNGSEISGPQFVIGYVIGDDEDDKVDAALIAAAPALRETVAALTDLADAQAQENARLQGALHEAKAALIEVKREMWREAQPKWTMADFLNWAIVQQITSAIARARAALGDTP